MKFLSSLAQHGPSLREIYESFISESYSSITLADVLSAIAVDAKSVITRRHPLGFTHAELTPCVGAPVGERFRFHFWLGNAGTRDDLGDLHEHTWDLTSLVLAGEVDDTTLRASLTPMGTYQGSRIIYGDRNSSELVGRFNLETIESRRVPAGTVYAIPSRTVHLNTVTMVPTVTLVRSIEDNRGEGPLVFSTPSATTVSATPARLRVDTLDALDALTVALDGGSTPVATSHR
ncbi:hypothetical protein [Agromyces sp. Marseille-Q5079]|uniref:hypothetical protein n=1 Tax=Agromyces sp. Marseille-Q5079 TaxID=3439059 RepID=UPI003D9C9EB9